MLRVRAAVCVFSLCWSCAHQATGPVIASADPVSTPSAEAEASDARVASYGPGATVAAEPETNESEDRAEKQLKLAQARAAGCGVGLR